MLLSLVSRVRMQYEAEDIRDLGAEQERYAKEDEHTQLLALSCALVARKEECLVHYGLEVCEWQ